MLIPVIYQNEDCGLVDSGRLDELIAGGKIKQFLRLEGWISAGAETIRTGRRRDGYSGQERRQDFRFGFQGLTDLELLGCEN